MWNMWVCEHVWNMWVCEHVCGICGCVSMCVEYVMCEHVCGGVVSSHYIPSEAILRKARQAWQQTYNVCGVCGGVGAWVCGVVW